MNFQSWEKSNPVRQFKRFRYPPDLTVSYEGADGHIHLSGPEISVQGMFINTPAILPEGAVLRVSFQLTRVNFKVAVRCEVRYCLPGVGVGVEFIDLPAAARDAIDQEVASRPELEPSTK